MDPSAKPPLVSTIKEKCRVCYTCVRECPAKAIRISLGQAEVIPERCIGCGNCVRVCSQHAKQVLSSTETVYHLLESGAKTAACLAPSFPAEFINLDPQKLVGMVRDLGFSLVTEVSFGADLVTERYKSLLSQHPEQRYIATTCPAVVEFVTRYHPHLVPSLAPVVSPMVALARALRILHGKDLKVVFIGPCIAKKYEAPEGEVDAVLTFQELRHMFREERIFPGSIESSEFDPPHGGLGSLYPISRGLLQAAGIPEDLFTGEVVAADGKSNFVEAIREFETGDLEAKLLEVLCCNGCIMGSGISNALPLFNRRSMVSRYSRARMARLEQQRWRENVSMLAALDLHRTFETKVQRVSVPSEDELMTILGKMGKRLPQDELNCGACGYDTCREHAKAIYRGLAESEMCLPYTLDQFHLKIQELAVSNQQLVTVQEALVQSEKLASMGQLSAGIAHEINNPLGVVLMYSHLLLSEYGKDPRLKEDLGMIVEQTERVKEIVAGLLNFARQNKVVYHPADIRLLVDRSLKTIPVPAHVKVQIDHEIDDPLAELDGIQVTQVLVNLIDNAFAAMPQGGQLTIHTDGTPDHIRFTVTDTGVGIPQANLKKIFEPFYTTKPLGKGTGLGLAVTYGIVKMHRGDIQVKSNADPMAGPTGSVFTATLPRKAVSD
jgi:two-component system NtrC family sensor kinase